MEYSSMNESCVASGSEKRIIDAIKYWQWCEYNYYKPDEFRRNLNGLIQEIRNSTFVLQSQKKKIIDFDSWYSLWQEKMSTDEGLKWLKDSRNTVVKSGDLNTNSKFIAKIIYGWRDEDEYSFDIPLKLCHREAIQYILSIIDKKEFPEGTFIVLERSWREVHFPNQDILKICTHGIRFIADLIIDLHEKRAIECDDICDFKTTIAEFICNADRFEEKRKLWFTLDDLKIAEFHFRAKNPKDIFPISNELIERNSLLPTFESTGKGIIDDLILLYSQMSIINFERDGLILTCLFAGKGNCRHMQIPLFPQNRAEKHILLRRAAERIAYAGMEWVIMIGEVWTSTTIPKTGFAADDENRGEAVYIQAIDSKNILRCVKATIVRDENGQHLEPFIDESFGESNIMDLFYRYMNRFKLQGAKEKPSAR